MRAVLLFVLVLLLVPAAAGARPVVQAHRGGSVLNGLPTFPENTLPGFENAARHGWVAEMDAKLTKDGVPVIIHDDSLDRTTACTGLVVDITLADLERRCRSDVLGSPGAVAPSRATKPTVPLPTVAAVLAALKRRHGRVSLEIKNYPSDRDFDPTYASARKILAVIKASGFPLDHLIIQSFTPQNLAEARKVFPRVTTAQLIGANLPLDLSIRFAKMTDATFLSPAWPLPEGYLAGAHRAGYHVVPYTLDTPAEVREATIAGADALITDDPAMATREIARAPFDAFRLRFTTARRGVSSGFSLRLHQPVPVGTQVPVPRSLSVLFPAGARLDPRAVPAGTRLGRGALSVAARTNSRVDAPVVLTATRTGVKLSGVGGPTGLGTLTGRVRGGSLAFSLPKSPTLTGLTLTVSAHGRRGTAWLRTPAFCERGHVWHLGARADFARPLGLASPEDVSPCR